MACMLETSLVIGEIYRILKQDFIDDREHKVQNMWAVSKGQFFNDLSVRKMDAVLQKLYVYGDWVHAEVALVLPRWPKFVEML